MHKTYNLYCYALSFEPLLPHCVCVLPLGPFSQNYAVLVQFAALKRRSMKFLTSCKGFSHGWASASAKATKIVQCSKESPAQKNDKCFEKKSHSREEKIYFYSSTVDEI